MLVSAWLAVTLLCAVAAPSPCLVFGEGDLPALRQRAGTDALRAVRDEVLQSAAELVDARSPSYANPDHLDQGGGSRIQIQAHTFGRRLTHWTETLGLAYRLTGERRYAEHVGRLLDVAAKRLPASDPRVAKSFAGARGDIMRGLAIGLDWCGDQLPAAVRQAALEQAGQYVDQVLAEARGERCWWVPNHNFIGVAIGAAGCLTFLLEEAQPEAARRQRAECVALVTRWLDSGFDGDGAYGEGVLYANYGLSNAVLFAEALVRNGGPNLFAHPRLQRVPQFYAASLLPGEAAFDARNDSDYCRCGEAFARLADRLDSPLARWIWQRAAGGSPAFRLLWTPDGPARDPVAAGEPLARWFRGRGLAVFRTGWTTADVMFAIEAGPHYPGTHNQADKGHFSLYGLGQRWAIDSGYGNNQEPLGTAQTVAHNCLLIDGGQQALSGAGLATDGELRDFAETPAAGYVLADCTAAYERNNAGRAGAVVRQARRHAIFVRPSHGAPAYAAVLDDIRKDDAEHDYTWLMHTPAGHEVTLRPDGAVIQPTRNWVETPPDATGQGVAEWSFELPADTELTVWARVRAGGPELSKSDSFFVKVDDAAPAAWHMPTVSDWTWGRVSDGVAHREVRYRLTAGRHLLRLMTREPGAQACQVVLAPVGAEPPFGTGAVVLSPDQARLTAPMRRAQAAANSARLRLLLSAAAPCRLALDGYAGHLRLAATTRAVSPDIVALLLPLPAGVAEPQVTWQRDAQALTVDLEWPDRRDRLVWPVAAPRRPVVTVAARIGR